MAIVRPNAWSAVPARAEASVDTQPGPRRQLDDESVLNEDDDELEPFDPGDDSDLGLEGLDEEDDEDVGLDTSVGFDEGTDDLDLPDLNDDVEGDWAAESEDSAELVEPDSELDEEEQEYGWIDEDESAPDDDDFADELDDEPVSSGDDGGAEGLEDESEIDDLDLSELPALDKDEEETGLPGLENVDELAAYGLFDEPMIEIAPGQSWKMLRARATRLTHVAWPADADSREALLCALNGSPAEGAYFARSLAAHMQTLYWAAGGLYRLDANAEAFTRLPLPAADLQQLVVAEHEGAVHILAMARGQLLLSSDAGASFAAQPTSYATHAGFTHSAAGLRLWWRSADAEIGSDSQIARAPGRALYACSDGRRSIAWLSRADQLLITASADGGKTFVSWPAPPEVQALEEADLRIETCDSFLLLSAAGKLWCGEHGAPLTQVDALLREPATLADEEGQPALFACVERQDEWFLVRRPARVPHAAPFVLAALGAKPLGELLALAVGYGEGGWLSAFVACQEGVLRVEASLDGEELA